MKEELQQIQAVAIVTFLCVLIAIHSTGEYGEWFEISGTKQEIIDPSKPDNGTTLKAFEYRKHVLVEKPISVTPSEADQMIKASRSNNLKLSVLFNNRFRTQSIKMKELIKSGELGEIYRASVSSGMFRTQDYYDQLAWRGTWEWEGG